jgi:hypothetical protein
MTSRSLPPFDHVYAWGNNSVRAKLKGRRCRVLVRGRMNSILVEFENGYKTVTSRYAIREDRSA